MALDAITSFNGQSPAALTTAAEKGVVDKQDFLTLLMTQLKNQDPLDPMKGTEFTAQLAQFSALEQLQNISAKLDKLTGSQSGGPQVNGSMDYLGRTVTFDGSSVTLNSGATAQVPFTLEGDAANTIFTFYDAEGNAVRTVNAGARSAGAQIFTWDGSDNNGQRLADGSYTVTLQALNSQGQPVAASTTFTDQVTEVAFENGTTYLVAGGQRLPAASVVRVTAAPQSTTAALQTATTVPQRATTAPQTADAALSAAAANVAGATVAQGVINAITD